MQNFGFFQGKIYKSSFCWDVMVLRIEEASALRIGTYVLVDGEAYVIRSMDVSKTGKHGHAKCRFDAIGIISDKKKMIMVPGHERFEIPLIEKKKAQVLSIMGDTVSLMDSESFENFEINIPADLKDQVKDGVTVEYWNIEGKKMIKRVV